jgi:hypothetical protein
VQHFISPSFTHEKLEVPLYKDVVDVFEDRMLYWVLMPAKKLLKIKHGEVAAVALATNYIEGIEIYISGKDSKGRSRAFFKRSFKRIFLPVPGEPFMLDAVADALYDSLRCGFAHESLFRNNIYFSSVRKEALTVTWPKKGGRFDPNGKLESAVINPARFIEGIEHHFTEYVKELRSRAGTPAKAPFLTAVEMKWGLSKPGDVIAMTEREFESGA